MNTVSLISSGIDSPVATYLMAPYCDKILLLHADNRPFTDERELQNFLHLARHLKEILPCTIEAFIVPHGNTLQHYHQTCTLRFTCVFCKRLIVRYAEKIATKYSAEAIVMGDSLGQVASQTLQNLVVVDQAATLPILRPLIGYDKTEVIALAEKIGTYPLSIQPSASCSAVPSKPATKASIEQIQAEEQKLPLNKLITEAVQNRKKIHL